MGFESGQTDEIFASTISEVHREIEKFIDIKAEIKIFKDFRFIDQTQLWLNKLTFTPGATIAKQMEDSEAIALVICTAGKGIAEYVKKAMELGDSFMAYTIDMYGSGIVESAMDKVQENFKNKMEEQGLKITNRYSPGYCEWDVKDQHLFFSLFPENYPGIKLTKSALMDPVKSVSCVIGIGEKVKYNPYTCSLCKMEDCIYRKRKISV